ncbi:hypothetical protein GCM10027449_26200 [Sinomonas notoginsengisoli]
MLIRGTCTAKPLAAFPPLFFDSGFAWPIFAPGPIARFIASRALGSRPASCGSLIPGGVGAADDGVRAASAVAEGTGADVAEETGADVAEETGADGVGWVGSPIALPAGSIRIPPARTVLRAAADRARALRRVKVVSGMAYLQELQESRTLWRLASLTQMVLM